MMGQPSEVAELHAWAANEAAALLNGSVQKRSDAVLREFDVVRKAFETAVDSIAQAAPAPIRIADIGAFVGRLTDRLGLAALRAELQEQEATSRRLGELLTTTRAELEAARRELDHERSQARAAVADAGQMRAEFDTSLDDLRREHATVLGEQARTYASLPLDQLLTVFHGLVKATTLSDVLTTLVDGIRSEFSRVALFDVRGGGLQCRRQIGLDFPSDISKLVIPLLGDSLLTRAVKTGQLEGFFAGPHSQPGTAVPFGGTPACALAIPVVVQRATVAVIYADDCDGTAQPDGAPHARAKFAELLHQHALLVLHKLSVERRPQMTVDTPSRPEIERIAPVTAADVPRALRELAFKLTDDLECDYTANAEVGRNRVECQRRLQQRLEHSRRLYSERTFRDEAASAASFLDEHLLAVVRARNETSFGQDLGALLSS